MVDVTSGLTPTQAAAVTAVLNFCGPDIRGGVSAMIGQALGPPGFVPFSDAAVLRAVGRSLVRYSVP